MLFRTLRTPVDLTASMSHLNGIHRDMREGSVPRSENEQIRDYGSVAIKIPPSSVSYSPDGLHLWGAHYLQQAIVSRDLQNHGVRVPYVYGVALAQKIGDIPILVMENIRATPISVQGLKNNSSAWIQYSTQRTSAVNAGYVPSQGYDEKIGLTPHGNIRFLDFFGWSLPARVKDRVSECVGSLSPNSVIKLMPLSAEAQLAALQLAG